MTPNPAWVNRAIGENWEAIVRRVPAEWLPIEKPTSTPRRRAMEEYGTGSYGTVMPTSDPSVVVKVTSDPLEAHFVAAAIRLKYWPDGIVRYHAIYQMPDVLFRGRPTFILWREAAKDVGDLSHRVYNLVSRKSLSHDDREEFTFKRRLMLFGQVARFAKDTIQRSARSRDDAAKWEDWAYKEVVITDEDLKRGGTTSLYHCAYCAGPVVASSGIYQYRGPMRVAAAVRACEIIAEYMEHEPVGYLVGGALGYYLDQKLLLADVHTGNIGKVTRDGEYEDGVWVITDPGHAVPLDKKWDDVSVESL